MQQGAIAVEAKVEEGLGRSFSVFIWQGCWQMVSGHYFKGHAEDIKKLIEKGGSKEQVQAIIATQKVYGRSIYKGVYHLQF